MRKCPAILPDVLVFTVYLVRGIFLIQILDTFGNMFLDKEINTEREILWIGYISRGVTTCTHGTQVRT